MFVRICVIIGVFVVIALCGYIKQRKREKRLIEHRAFLVDYRNRFVEYANHGDQEAYQFLNQHMSKAQHYMGTIGILDKLRLPFENVYHVNVPVLSMLSHIASYRDNHLSYNEYARMIDDTLTRAVGDHEDLIDRLEKKILNPFYCFYVGFNMIFSLPFIAISYMFTGENHIESNGALKIVMKIAATIVQLLGLISAIITIVIGWEEFVALLHKWFT